MNTKTTFNYISESVMGEGGLQYECNEFETHANHKVRREGE